MRIRSPTTLPQQIAFAWYDREQWELLRELSVDPEELNDSFDQWELTAIQAESEMLAKGFNVKRFPVIAKELVAWCQAKAHPLNRAARSKFVAERSQLLFPASNG